MSEANAVVPVEDVVTFEQSKTAGKSTDAEWLSKSITITGDVQTVSALRSRNLSTLMSGFPIPG
jgi:hypothetical protein